MDPACDTSRPVRDAAAFATTRWTAVRAAGQGSGPQSEEALERICASYWFPLYAYIRRRGHPKEDAEDLTQGFLTRLLANNPFGGLDPERGRFRSFLLGALKHYLANERDRSRSLKRGGGMVHLSLDQGEAEAQFQAAAAETGQNPDRVFDREWALALLAAVIGRLEAECSMEGRARQFDELRVFLTVAKGARPYASPARALGMEEGAARVAVHRLRGRYRELLRQEIARTLADPAQADEEMRALFAALAG